MIPSATYHAGKRYPVHLQLSCGCQVESLTEARIAYWQHEQVVCYGALCKGHFAQFNAWPEHEAQHVIHEGNGQ